MRAPIIEEWLVPPFPNLIGGSLQRGSAEGGTGLVKLKAF